MWARQEIPLVNMPDIMAPIYLHYIIIIWKIYMYTFEAHLIAQQWLLEDNEFISRY